MARFAIISESEKRMKQCSVSYAKAFSGGRSLTLTPELQRRSMAKDSDTAYAANFSGKVVCQMKVL